MCLLYIYHQDVNNCTHLITDMQSKYKGNYPSRRVSPMMLCPLVMDVFKEGWIYNYYLEHT